MNINNNNEGHEIVNLISTRCNACIEGAGCLNKFDPERCESLASLIKDHDKQKELEGKESKVLEFLKSEKPDDEPVDMEDMKLRVQTNLLIARKEIYDTNTFTASAMISIVDALFYLVQNVNVSQTQKFSVEVPNGVNMEDILRHVAREMKRARQCDERIYVCGATGNYCTECTPGPCEHRK